MFEKNNAAINQRIHSLYTIYEDKNEFDPNEPVINAIIKELEDLDRVQATNITQTTSHNQPTTLSISVKNSSGVYMHLGTFTIDFNQPEPTARFDIPEYTTDVSNPILHSFLSKLYKTSVLPKLTDDQLAFIAQFEALKTALAQKTAYKSFQEKKLCNALENTLEKIGDLQTQNPAKTNELTQTLTIFNKIINGQATSKDIDKLFGEEVKKQPTESSTSSGQTIAVAAGIIGITLTAAGIIGSVVAHSLVAIFMPLFVVGVITLLATLVGGIGPIRMNIQETPLLNEDLRKTINESGLVQKTQASNIQTETNIGTHYPSPVPSTPPTPAQQTTETTQTTAPKFTPGNTGEQ